MAVFTIVSGRALCDLLSRYDLGTLERHEGIEQGVENTNYHVYTSKGHYILTLFEKRVNAADLPFFFAYMTHLRQKGLACPDVLADREGEIIHEVEHRPAALFSFLDGGGVEPARITPAHCRELGAYLARMHLAVADFPGGRPNSMGLEAWRQLYHRAQPLMDGYDDGLSDYLAAALDDFAANWPADLPSGVVHADLFPDNLFFGADGKISGAIDFYFSCTAPFAYDIALTVNAWCFANAVPDPARLEAFFQSYEAVRPLTAHERGSLRFFGRAAALRILMTRLNDYLYHNPNDLVVPKDPGEYLRLLRYHSGEDAAVLPGECRAVHV